MKISQKSKKVSTVHPQIFALIADISAKSKEDLPAFLATIDSWKWPRSDLNMWIKVLNKFDEVLEDIIREYEVDKIQTKEFDPLSRQLLFEILKFERFLLENSTNRKMFNSYDRLNSLLFTSDLDVLVATLFLLLRPSQQYSSQPAVSHSLHISTSRLESLARFWPSLRDHGIDMLDLVSDLSQDKVEKLTPETSEVNFTFYRKADHHTDGGKEATESTSADAKSADQPAGPVTVHLGPLSLSSRSAMEILNDTVNSYQVPESERYELMCRIRMARALGSGRSEDRQKLIVARLLAIAIYGHTHTEAQAQASLFLYEGDLLVRLADLLQLDRGVPVIVQTAAIAAMDAIARYRGKILEVLAAINAGVNHGIAMSLFRKTVTEVANPESTLPHIFVDALLTFVIYLASHASGGSMVVSAGLVPLLIQIIGNTLPQRLAVVSKAMQLVDNVLYGFVNAFQIFCNGHGVEVLTERIKHEVQLAVETHGKDSSARVPSGTYGLLHVSRASVLKHVLRSMLRMMQASGTAEGMRTLIDSSLLQSAETVIEYRGVFGPTVLPIAINIVATFVHNEPTSLTTIQEAKVPETIYGALEAGLEPSIEVIQSIPNAIGALCLNQAGQDQLAARPSVIPALFSIFTSEKHLKVLQDKESAALIGASIDELIRHHPSLKMLVFDAVLSVISKIEALSSVYTPPPDIENWYRISAVRSRSAVSEDVTMEDAPKESETERIGHESNLVQTGEEAVAAAIEESAVKSHDNVIVHFIDILGRFLEGLFQHNPHCKDFILEKDGLNHFTRLVSLPCLPYDFANSPSSDSLVQVIRTMTEAAPAETHTHLVGQIKQSLDTSERFWVQSDGSSMFTKWIDISDETTLQDADGTFRQLITLHNRLTLLSDVCASIGYTHNQSSYALLQALSRPEVLAVITNLGALHRACLFENIALKSSLASKGEKDSTTRSLSPDDAGQTGITAAAANGEAPEALRTDVDAASGRGTDDAKNDTPQDCNARALRHVASQIPNTLAPFYQALSRTLSYVVARRGYDTTMRQQAWTMSVTIAEVMHKHLTDVRTGDNLTSYAYYTVMLGLVTVLLSEDRGSQTTVQMMLLFNFRRNGGLDAVLNITRRYTDAIARIANVKTTDRTESDKQELVHVYGGLKVALHLLSTLVSYKPSPEQFNVVFGSPDNKPETHPDYFEPHDFLVKLRLSVAPIIFDMWQTTWINSAPPGVSKYVVQIVLDILAGENEEGRPTGDQEMMLAATTGASTISGMPRPTVPVGPDEDRIRQLIDMGFSRSAAIRALIRSHNNVSVATEYLLIHPELSDPDPEDGAGAVEGGTNEEVTEDAPVEPIQPDTEDHNAAGSTNEETVANAAVESVTFDPEKSAAERREELGAIRMSFRCNIGPAALRLLDAHPTLIFDIRQFFVGQPAEQTAEPTKTLIDDVEKFSPAAYDINEEPLALRFRLLALILMDSPKSIVGITGTRGQSLMDILDALLLSQPIAEDKDQHLPKWLSALMLSIEALLVLSDEPQAIAIPLGTDSVAPQILFNGPSYMDVRSHVFDLCMRLLVLPTLPRDEYLAALRLMVYLTRNEETARDFAKRDGLSLLLQSFKALSSVQGASACQSYTAIILRHLAEDKATLERFMRHEIKRLMAQPRSRDGDHIANYVRNCAPMASRDAQLFVQVTGSLCQLSSPDPTARISLKPVVPEPDASKEIRTEKPEDGAMQVDVPAIVLNVPSEAAEAVVHFLLAELLRAGKSASDSIKAAPPLSQPKESQTDTAPVVGVSPSAPDRVDSVPSEPIREPTQDPTPLNHTDFLYACFLMQCLTELLFSYDHCKTAFLSFSRKKALGTSKEGHTRSKPSALNFLLSDLVSVGAFNVEPKYDSKKRVMLCNWAMSVVVALCVDSSPPSSIAAGTPIDLTAVRRVVLDAIARSIKDSSPGESTDARYGRILALADLCHRLLTVRFNAGVSTKGSEETPLHLAKIMLEKNFVATLTNVLSSVDLNYPNVRSLVAAILRPLEHLTKVAIKMGRSPDKPKNQQDKASDSSTPLTSDDSEDDVDEDNDDMDTGMDREETPDLYRNSSLGMYGGEMDEANYSSDEAMDEDGDEDDEEEEMDFDEEGDSDDTSNTDEEVDDVEDLTMPPHESTDEWHDEDDEMDDDGDDNDDEDSEDAMAADAGGADDPGIMWQDEIEADGVVVEAGDEDDELGDMPVVNDHTGDDGRDVDSDDDEAADGLGELEETGLGLRVADDAFMFGRQASRSSGRERGLFYTAGVPVTSRDGDADLHMFSRSRRSTDHEATAHPLLLDPTSLSQTSPTQIRVHQRRPQRGTLGQLQNGMLQILDDAFGEGAAGLLQHIVSRTVAGGMVAADIHVDIPATTMHLIAGMDRGHHRISRRGGPAYTIRERAANTRSDNVDFGPLPTIQRLSEEAKILHGKHLQDRLAKLVNHILVVLLPDAREKAKKDREKAEALQKAREEAAAEAATAAAASTEQNAPTAQDNTDSILIVGEAMSINAPVVASVDDAPTAAAVDAGDTDMLVEPSTEEEAIAVIQEQSTSHDPEAVEQDSVTVAEPVEAIMDVSTTPVEEVAREEAVMDGPSTSTAAERVTVLIHGNHVDITDTGIDPTFLEALPDDMREEVLNQHFREQRSSRVEQAPESQISPEFLEALPPELRAELLQQELSERSRRTRQGNDGQTAANTGTGPVDMDTATFIASLDPHLRQVVLLDQDDGFLQTLPSHMIAEVGAYRENVPRMQLHVRHEPPVATSANAQSPRKPAPQRDAIQLLDRLGVASLVRLLFFPKLRRHVLHKIMLNLCENTKTRTELFNLLLSVLQDGTGDVAVVDRSFSQLSFKPTKTPSQTPSKTTPRPRANTDHEHSISNLPMPNEVPPDLVAQRCLDALASIVVSNEASSLFFLTEHELPAGLKKMTSKKGKGKEKQASQSHYPIVLLLSLLDRQTLLKTPAMMDSVAGLLDAVTRPLVNLKTEKKPTTDIATASSATAATETITTDTSDEQQGVVTDASAAEGTSVNPVQPENSSQQESQSVEEKVFLANPPQIPHPALRLIVNILTVGDCSSRTFQHTLALIQHLSCLPDARDVIAQELKAKAQEFGQNLYADLDALILALQNGQADGELPVHLAARFSPASSEQAKLLRVLKTIDYMYSYKVTQPGSSISKTETDEEGITKIYEAFHFAPLWQKLGDCLTVVEQKSNVEHVATILLPLIESLMVVCKHVGVKSSVGPSRVIRSPSSPRTPLTPTESMEDLFVSFTDNHRKILNLMVRNNPSLMSGSFSLLVQNSRVLDFDNKRNYFNQQLRRRPHPREHHGSLQLNVRRARVFEDSYHTFLHKSGDQIKYGKLSVRFVAEEGVDAGGVTREWFQILARQMFDPNYALFEPCAADKLTYQPNRASAINPDHLIYFKFVGRVIGKAIYDGRLMDAHFARSLYRQLLGKRVDYRDVEWVDPEYYKSLCWILENDPTVLDLTFITEVDEFGKHDIIPLKENGTTTLVTLENRQEYVQLSAQYRLFTSIKEQIEHLLAGFYEIVPKELISIFNEQEVELLIAGTPDIDVDEWRAATEYNGYSSSDPVIVWWWRALKSFTRDERAKVLSFATGTSRVPLGGFVDLQGVQGVQRFSIHRAYGHPDRLPQAHTCFNQIDLPQYTSYDMLRQQVLLAINEGGEGFGFA